MSKALLRATAIVKRELRTYGTKSPTKGTVMRSISFGTIRGTLRRRVMATLALTLVFVFGLTESAYADVIAEGSGVRGRGDWTWGVHELRDISLGVRDLTCDGNPVYVELRVSIAGDFTDTLRHDYNGGCGNAADWSNLYLHLGATILGVRVRACVNVRPGFDSCYLSEYHDNPLS